MVSNWLESQKLVTAIPFETQRNKVQKVTALSLIFLTSVVLVEITKYANTLGWSRLTSALVLGVFAILVVRSVKRGLVHKLTDTIHSKLWSMRTRTSFEHAQRGLDQEIQKLEQFLAEKETLSKN